MSDCLARGCLAVFADLLPFVLQISVAVVGIIGLAAGIAGYLFSELKLDVRIGILVAAGLLLSPDVRIGGNQIGLYTNIAGGVLFAVTVAVNWMRSRKESDSQTVDESTG